MMIVDRVTPVAFTVSPKEMRTTSAFNPCTRYFMVSRGVAVTPSQAVSPCPCLPPEEVQSPYTP